MPLCLYEDHTLIYIDKVKKKKSAYVFLRASHRISCDGPAVV